MISIRRSPYLVHDNQCAGLYFSALNSELRMEVTRYSTNFAIALVITENV